MKIKEIITVLEEMAPLAYAEDFDNVGLLTGNQDNEATGILVCHDALENVIEEAITKNCNLVVCFHPILFSGLKKITGSNYVERALIKAIKNDEAMVVMQPYARLAHIAKRFLPGLIDFAQHLSRKRFVAKIEAPPTAEERRAAA